MLTVSRSVDRVFGIIDLFTKRRRPLSATEIKQALNLPHSSTVAILTRLVDLGYFEQNPDTKKFFPSSRLSQLLQALPESIVGGNPIAQLVEAIQAITEETTSVSRLNDIFTVPICVRSAKHAEALRVIPGLPSGLAILSVVGRTLLSTLPDDEIERVISRSVYWARRAGSDVMADGENALKAIEFVRQHGYLCSFNALWPGVGTVSCPLLHADNSERLAISVGGTAQRIEHHGRQIISVVLKNVQQFRQSSLIGQN
jgi:DNA-binding IclR family transcriptional regulator